MLAAKLLLMSAGMLKKSRAEAAPIAAKEVLHIAAAPDEVVADEVAPTAAKEVLQIAAAADEVVADKVAPTAAKRVPANR